MICSTEYKFSRADHSTLQVLTTFYLHFLLKACIKIVNNVTVKQAGSVKKNVAKPAVGAFWLLSKNNYTGRQGRGNRGGSRGSCPPPPTFMKGGSAPPSFYHCIGCYNRTMLVYLGNTVAVDGMHQSKFTILRAKNKKFVRRVRA